MYVYLQRANLHCQGIHALYNFTWAEHQRMPESQSVLNEQQIKFWSYLKNLLNQLCSKFMLIFYHTQALSLCVCVYCNLYGENLRVVWAKFSTLSQTVLLKRSMGTQHIHGCYQNSTLRTCQLKFVTDAQVILQVSVTSLLNTPLSVSFITPYYSVFCKHFMTTNYSACCRHFIER